jgi:SIR2-like domain
VPKPKAVVILGAGASVDFGVPQLKGLFKDRHARQHIRGDNFLRSQLDTLFWEPRGHTLESSDESLTVEEMLTLLRDWEDEDAECGQAPAPDLCNKIRKSLYVMTKKAIFDGKDTRNEHLNPILAFCRRRFSRTTWATFNWDCIFESTFWYSQPYAGPGSRSNPSVTIPLTNWRNGTGKHVLLKLHGAINWWKESDSIRYLQWSSSGELSDRWQEYEGQDQDTDDGPVILEPSAYKYQHPRYRLLEPQWKIFFEHLCEADYVIVIGYSLPENDTQARSRIAVACQVNQRCKWLAIDPSSPTLDRYKRILGRRVLTTLDTTLAGFNNELEDTLSIAFPTLLASDPEDPEVAV